MGTHKQTLFFAGFLLAIIFLALATDLPRRRQGGVISDEATYFALTQSLAYDGDIKYGREDIVRIRERFWNGPTGIFLRQAENGKLYYGKSFVYPLLAAPFFRLFDVRGILLFNGIMLLACVLMAFKLLEAFHPPSESLSFSLLFFFTTVAWIYIWWLTADLFNCFAMFAGLFFFFYPFRRRFLFYLSPIFFSLAILSKPNNVVPVAIVCLILLWRRRFRQALAVMALFLACAALFFAFIRLQGNDLNFMGGDRRSFQREYPLERPWHKFASGYLMTADDYWQRYHISPGIAILNLFYYFFGRFTGMFIYFFPAVFLLVLFFFQRKVPEDWFVLAAIAASILVFILLDPGDYFGGGGSLGNRYFLSIFPLFFFLGFRTRIFRWRVLPLLAAILFLTPVFLDGLWHSAYPATSGKTWPLKLFPPEKTQFKSLPSNLNPRAYYQIMHSGQFTCLLFFLDDNFYPLEHNAFWTHGDDQAELLLLTFQHVRHFRIHLTSSSSGNRAEVAVDHARATVQFKGGTEGVADLTGLSGLQVDNRYVYHVRVRSRKFVIPFFHSNYSPDVRKLGVKVWIEPVS